jgi:GNAT superfamily N-acetyltransferase
VAALRIRTMTADEFDVFLSRAVAEYAQDHVQAGDWSAHDAERLADEQTAALLPQGRDTPGMLFLVPEDELGLVGTAWVAVDRSGRRGAWIYTLEVAPERRGTGRGRALLESVESAARDAGATTIGLNVFGDNARAHGLYETSGYAATSLQLRKALR